MTFKGVLIDFGDTLAFIDEDGNRKYTEAILSVLRKFGYQGSSDGFAVDFDEAIRNSTKGEVKNLHEFWNLLLENLGIHNAPAALTRELETIRSRYSTTVFRPYDGAFQVLADLQVQYKLALVSNCAVGTSDVLEDLGLTGYFDCVTLSYQVGVRKPDRLIYLKALECLQLEPHDCIFVADEISDLEGARDVGMRTLLVRQGVHTFTEAKNRDFEADFQCNRISEIAQLL